jgi:hypothetical protein
MTLTVAVIKLRSYGFLHPGRERFKRVTKECWRFIPGSTLYGAVAVSLIRQDCKKGCATLEKCRACVDADEISCGYSALLLGAKNNNWRFSPLIPLKEQDRHKEAFSLRSYCRDALENKPRMAVVPRAPQDRFTGSISENRLHGVVAHMPFQDYWGFVIAPEAFVNQHLDRALAALPFFPFGGGRGKFTQLEAEVIRTMPIEEFAQDLINPHAVHTLKLLTPAMIVSDNLKIIAESDDFKMVGFRPRLYSTWRTGLYWEDGGWKDFGHKCGASRHMSDCKWKNECDPDGNIRKCETTIPRTGVEEGMRIIFKKIPDASGLQKELLFGFGNPDFTRLGWGQFILEEKTS